MNHLYFTKIERRALLSLIVILCLTHIVLLLLKWEEHKTGIQNQLVHVEVHEKNQNSQVLDTSGQSTVKTLLVDLPAFNKKPMIIHLDALSSDMLRSHDLPETLINNWINYYKKGMRFKTKQNIMQVYGMTEKIYTKIESYIIFPNKMVYNEKLEEIEKPIFETESNNIEQVKIDINGANEQDLQKLYGIGKVLSSRIVKYRDLIGGYVSKEQLYKVYGLRSTLVDSLSDQILIDETAIKRLNVFEATEYELSELYFVSPYLAKKIKQLTDSRYVQINSQADLVKHLDYDKAKLKQALPYLSFSKNEGDNSD